jgi:hypothetical protein
MVDGVNSGFAVSSALLVALDVTSSGAIDVDVEDISMREVSTTRQTHRRAASHLVKHHNFKPSSFRIASLDPFHDMAAVNKTSPLPTRQLGKNGPQVASIGLGLMGLSVGYGPALPDEERLKFLDAAYEKGEWFWDTCTCA